MTIYRKILALLTLVLGLSGLFSGASLAAGGGGGDGPIFLNMQKIDVTIVNRGKPSGFLRVFLVLDLADPLQQPRVEANALRIHNAFLEYFQFYLQTRTKQDRELDLEKIRVALKERVDRMFGPNVIGQVLFRSIMVQSY